MRIVIAWIAAFLTAACSSAPPKFASKPARAGAANSTATLSIVRLSPPAGSWIDGETILRADVEYAIMNFDRSREYLLVPLFD
jgi:MFS-type transporter involved in bile tolerance (Atg22 family)